MDAIEREVVLGDFIKIYARSAKESKSSRTLFWRVMDDNSSTKGRFDIPWLRYNKAIEECIEEAVN